MQKLSRWFTLLFAFSCCLLSACDNREAAIYVDPEIKKTKDSHLSVATEPSLRLGIGSIITPKEGYIYYQRLVGYLERKLEMPVTVIDRGTYQGFNELLAEGGLDIAFVCGGPYVEGKEAFDLELLVVPETQSGEKVYYSDLIVAKDSTVLELEELRGKSFAFTDPQSNSGKLVPTFLLSKRGETPENFFGEIIYTYAHDKSILAVAEKTVAAASVDSLIYEYIIDKNPELAAKTRILSKTGPYGIPPVVVRPNISEELRTKLKTLLLEMDQDQEGREILEGMKISRFVESHDDAYDSIRQIRDFTHKQAQN